jgi:hypothetical protein
VREKKKTTFRRCRRLEKKRKNQVRDRPRLQLKIYK